MRRDRQRKAIARAGTQRKRMSEAEKRLWTGLRRKTLGFRFRRQYTVAGYCLDFYCPETEVCVEVDGDFHDRAKDADRDARLASLGILTVRIPTGELYPSVQPALDMIWKACDERVKKPPP